jgi:hypothetical protein
MPAGKGDQILSPPLQDDDGFDADMRSDVLSLLEENARLRALVTQLSSLILKHLVDKKDKK